MHNLRPVTAITKPGYFLDDQGNMYTTLKRGKVGQLHKLKLSATPPPKNGGIGGYLMVTIWEKVDGRAKQKTYALHRLMCLTFHGEPPSSDHVVDHILGSDTVAKRQDNRADNLQWTTKSKNQLNISEDGRRRRREFGQRTTGNNFTIGSKQGRSKLTEPRVIKILELLTLPKEQRPSQSDIAEREGVDPSIISKIASGKIWKRAIEEYVNKASPISYQSS